jgi:predicted transglutaminase-like cysteine proteinase
MKYIYMGIVVFSLYSCTEPDVKINLTNRPLPNYNIDWENSKLYKNYIEGYAKNNILNLQYLELVFDMYINYTSDKDVWGIDEYWQTPEQTFKLMNGDCEDEAILFAWVIVNKYQVNPNDLKLAKCQLPNGGHHAFLIVEMQNRTVNLFNHVSKEWTLEKTWTYEQCIKIAHYTHDPSCVVFY